MTVGLAQKLQQLLEFETFLETKVRRRLAILISFLIIRVDRPLTGCIEGLVHCSSLCAALAEAFNAISNRKVARLTSLNRHIDIQLIVHDEVFDRNHSPTPDVHPAVAPTPGFLRPPGPAKDRLAQHQTLIPVEDPLAMQKELERSPPSDLPLMQFLEIMTPTLKSVFFSLLAAFVILKLLCRMQLPGICRALGHRDERPTSYG